jgi:peptidoglycan/LPS O-acetylase OafA/YrhL
MNLKKPIFFPGLNGIRALAALAVVISHITLELGKFNLNTNLLGTNADGSPKGLMLAGFGVSMFFSLSGFLITYLLLAEKRQQEINIKKFYFRRILRIWPLYYLYLIIALIVIFYFNLQFKNAVLLCYIFLGANFPFILGNIQHNIALSLPFLNHYWSLGVEEQYYLFWPWIVKKTKIKLQVFIAIFILTFIVLKCIFHFFLMNSFIAACFNIIRFDCMLIGSLGAVLYFKNNILFLKIFTSKLFQCIAWFFILLLLLNIFHIASVIDHEIVSTVTLVLIIGQITLKNRIINLDLKVFDFLGKISYGTYVIHPIIIFFFTKAFKVINWEPAPILKYICVYTIIPGVTVFFAWLSYEFFEKRFLILKMKFTAVASSNTRNINILL